MGYQVRAIVVGVADPRAEDPALQAAVDMARRTGAALHAVHAFELPVPFLTADAIQYTGAQAIASYTEEVRSAFQERLHEAFREDPIVCHAVVGAPERAILATAEEVHAGLVVVGPTHRGRLEQMLLGTTAQRVLRESPCPVFLIHHWPVHTQRVLVTTDLSSASALVYEDALDIVDVMYDGDTTEVAAMLVVLPMPVAPPLSQEVLERAASSELAAFLAERRVRERPAAARLRFGTPSVEIRAEAERWGADLVVLGTHARQAPTRWLLGSVAESTLKSLRCNLLVVPPTAAVPAAPVPSAEAAGGGAP